MSEGTSHQGHQAFDSEPSWVSHVFDRMSLMESNFNTRMDTMESNFNVRFTQMDENLAHLQHDVHHILSNKAILAVFYLLFLHHLHPLLLPSCIFVFY